MQTTRAKFKVHSVTHHDGSGRTIKLGVVYPSKDEPENKAFWTATPSGSIELYIDNPAAFAIFEPGATVYVDFTPAK